ncbi:MAG: exonuclease domain-containing protein, partial [Candidatus Binatia bacterium]
GPGALQVFSPNLRPWYATTAMREKLHAYLMERPSGATAGELLDLIFTRPAADRDLGPRFLQVLLGADQRFAWRDSAACWVATAHEALAQGLDETAFVVVDLETTGGAPAVAGIIEIGAVRVHGGKVVDRFEQLVDPGCRLPRFITGLTGISDAMLAGQPDIAAVLPRFVAFAADSVLVAHNASFDMGFLNAARLAASGRVFDQPHVCTLRLAKRLLPNLRRRSLDALAGHFGIPVIDRHRALGDAQMTAEVLFHLLELLPAQGVRRVDQLLDLQHRASDGRRFVCQLPRARVAALPTAPGIYRFTGEDGRLLYIGKARNLRQRVGSYLSNAAAHRGKVLDLIRHIRAVDVEVAGSELEASLREAEEIRRCQPPYNRLSKHLPQIAFLKLTRSDAFPRLTIARKLGGGRGRYFGPFRSRAAAQHAQGLLARLFHLRTCSGRLRPAPEVSPCLAGQIGACPAPCAARITTGDYGALVDAAERFFDGESDAVCRTLIERREAHSAALRFEAAAREQRDLELVQRMRRRQKTMSWIVARQHFVVMQPAADRTHVLLYAVRHGRLLARGAAHGAAGLTAFAAQLAAPDRTAGALRPEEVDGTVILAAWLRARGERDGYVFPLDAAALGRAPHDAPEPDAPVDGRLPEWTAALNSLLALTADANGRPLELPAPAEPER